ncbi:MAG: SRPBCC family protein [Pirellulales bacterium]
MAESNTNQIRRQIVLKAPMDRVWEALTDYRKFGEWFRVNLEVPFVVGQKAYGQMTYPGYEHFKLEVFVVAIEPKTRFAYTWHPYAVDPQVDYSNETPTTVEFTLEYVDGGTRLTVIESGFDAVPEWRRSEAFHERRRLEGTNGQYRNYLETTQ